MIVVRIISGPWLCGKTGPESPLAMVEDVGIAGRPGAGRVRKSRIYADPTVEPTVRRPYGRTHAFSFAKTHPKTNRGTPRTTLPRTVRTT